MKKQIQTDFFDKIFDSTTDKNFVRFDESLIFFKKAQSTGQKILTVTVVCGGYVIEKQKPKEKNDNSGS